MMRYGFRQFSIAAPFPTKQCGYISQTELIDTYHDDLLARVFFLEDKETIIHISLDLLAFDEPHRNELQDYLSDYYNRPIHLITSATHTHYANDVLDDKYVTYLMDLLKKEVIKTETKEVDLRYSVITDRFTGVGRSRISGYETGNEYVALIRMFDGEKPLVDIIIHNVHPTILAADVPYFSSEFPGYVLAKLKKEHPDEDFTYMSGAMGDISTRSTRPSQDYRAVEELGDRLVAEIDKLRDLDLDKKPVSLSYSEVILPFSHQRRVIDESSIRHDLTEREKEAIKVGQIMSQRVDLSKANPHAIIGRLDLGGYKLIFFPNEIFSEYLDDLDVEKSMLVSYSNGFGPYVLPIDFSYITYEMFLDTLDDDTKRELIAVLKEMNDEK